MRLIKNITEGLLIVIAVVALIMMTAEAETIWSQIICTLGSGGIFCACGKLLKKIDPEAFKEEEIL